jgi:hypothetical protein
MFKICTTLFVQALWFIIMFNAFEELGFILKAKIGKDTCFLLALRIVAESQLVLQNVMACSEKPDRRLCDGTPKS